MSIQLVLLVGAGSTFSDGETLEQSKRPPLDRGFFSSLPKDKRYERDLATVEEYLSGHYTSETVHESGFDSLEKVLRVIYSDMYIESTQDEALAAFRALLHLYNRRIAETTNSLSPKSSNLTTILRDWALQRYKQDEIAIVTFNQDLQIEKCLNYLDNELSTDDQPIFNFPYAYYLPPLTKMTAPTTKTASTFKTGIKAKPSRNRPGIDILKLHGSLNWYSRHNSQSPSRQALLKPNRKLHITRRSRINVEMTVTGSRTVYGFPIVVPPVVHKSGIFHETLLRIWRRAEKVLSDAKELIVFGYSCPETDVESENMLRRAFRQNTALETVYTIDPNHEVYARYGHLSKRHDRRENSPRLVCCRSAKAFLAQNEI